MALENIYSDLMINLITSFEYLGKNTDIEYFFNLSVR